MTPYDIFQRVNEVRPHQHDETWLLNSLLRLETMICDEVQHTEPPMELTMDSQLSVPIQYAALYEQWLMSQIDLADGEIDRYNTDVIVYNSQYTEYAAWYRRNNLPPQGDQVNSSEVWNVV